SGNIYVTGETGSTNLPTVNPVQASKSGRKDAFLAKLNREGNALIYSTYFGGDEEEDSVAIVLDQAGNVYITGYTSSTTFPMSKPVQPSNAGGSDAFIVKFAF